MRATIPTLPYLGLIVVWSFPLLCFSYPVTRVAFFSFPRLVIPFPEGIEEAFDLIIFDLAVGRYLHPFFLV